MRKWAPDYIAHNHENDGVDRRGFLKCMAGEGTGVLCVVKGTAKSYGLSHLAGQKAPKGELS